MVKQIRDIITENERNDIRSMYGLDPLPNIAITEWLSPDEKYCIFLDELYDIEKKIKMGNVFENFDNFRFFLKHSFEVAENITEEVKKDFFETYNSFVITESNQDMRELKPLVKELLKEWTANPFNKEFYTGDNWKEIGQKTVDVGKRAVQGAKDIASNISKGDWSAAMSIVGKGALWVARKIRSALYNPVGLVLDAILIATGIGKGFQFLVWATVVALDVYELTTGDYEEKDLAMGWRLLFFGIDILGMVTAGAAAKASKTFVGTLMRKFGSTSEGLSNAVKSSPQAKSLLSRILGASDSAVSNMTKAQSSLQKSSPMFYKFISGIMGGLKKFLTVMVNSIRGILNIGGKVLTAPGKIVQKVAPKSLKGTKTIAGTAAAANVIVPLSAIHMYGDHKSGQEMADFEKSLETATPSFDGV